MSKIKKIGPKNTKTYESARRVPRVTKEQLRAERYEALRFKNRFTTTNIGGFELIVKKHGKLTAEEIWKYQGKEIEKLFESYHKEIMKKAQGYRPAPISTKQKFFNLFNVYKGDYAKFVKDFTFTRPQSSAEYAYQMLKDTGRIEDLQIMANEEIDVNKIVYQRNNYYSYKADNGKTFLFEIVYQHDEDSNSYVDVEITEL